MLRFKKGQYKYKENPNEWLKEKDEDFREHK